VSTNKTGEATLSVQNTSTSNKLFPPRTYDSDGDNNSEHWSDSDDDKNKKANNAPKTAFSQINATSLGEKNVNDTHGNADSTSMPLKSTLESGAPASSIKPPGPPAPPPPASDATSGKQDDAKSSAPPPPGPPASSIKPPVPPASDATSGKQDEAKSSVPPPPGPPASSIKPPVPPASDATSGKQDEAKSSVLENDLSVTREDVVTSMSNIVDVKKTSPESTNSNLSLPNIPPSTSNTNRKSISIKDAKSEIVLSNLKQLDSGDKNTSIVSVSYDDIMSQSRVEEKQSTGSPFKSKEEKIELRNTTPASKHRSPLKRGLSLTNLPPKHGTTPQKSMVVGDDQKNILVRSLFGNKSSSGNSTKPKTLTKSNTSSVNIESGLDSMIYTDEITYYQLKGIFVLNDEDKDGYITKQQLARCLKLLGFQPREKLLQQYLNPTLKQDINMSNIRDLNLDGILNPEFAAGIGGNITDLNVSSPKSKQTKTLVKPTKLSGISTKVDLQTFLNVTLDQLLMQNELLERDLSQLLAFAGSENSDSVTLKDMRHLLVETMTDSRLSNKEFNEFLDGLGVNVLTQSQEKDHSINCSNLIDNLLMGRRWKDVIDS
jgi:hypothetical protein